MKKVLLDDLSNFNEIYDKYKKGKMTLVEMLSPNDNDINMFVKKMPLQNLKYFYNENDKKILESSSNDNESLGIKASYYEYYSDDSNKALEYLPKLIESNDAHLMTLAGLILRRHEMDYLTMLSCFIKGANCGISNALRWLGYMYEHGIILKKNLKEALRLYLLVSENKALNDVIENILFILLQSLNPKNYVDALIKIGPIVKNDDLLFKYLFQDDLEILNEASKRNIPKANLLLAKNYIENCDYDNAILYLNKNVRLNHRESINELLNLYRFTLGQIDSEEALLKRIIRKSKDMEYYERLGVILFEQNRINSAINYFKKSEALGNVSVRYYYAKRELNKNTAKSNEIAMDILTDLYKIDNHYMREIEYELSHLYLGLGDEIMYKKYLSLSSDKNYLPAQFEVLNKRLENNIYEYDLAQIRNLLNNLLKAKYKPVYMLASNLYSNGEVIKKDLKKAAYYRKLVKKAC